MSLCRVARIVMLAGVVSASGSMLAGCAGTGSSARDDAGEHGEGARGVEVASILRTWVVTQVDGQAITMPEGGRGAPTVTFLPEAGKVAGFAGVNRFFGSYDPAGLGRGELEFGPLGATKMAGPEELMNLEDRVMGAMSRAKRIGLSADTLTLRGEDGAEVLRLVPE